MPEFIIIGSSNAVPTLERDNTYFVLNSQSKRILIDCGNNAWVRLLNAGMTPESFTDIIVTHFHPDHVAGLPLLLMDLWLSGRKNPLTIHGLKLTLAKIEKMMELFDWKSWPGFFPVSFVGIPEIKSQIIYDDSISIWARPVKHLIPTIGLRIEDVNSSYSIAYTCDTEPCVNVDELARGANLLIHEAAGNAVGHSSAEQAGSTAARAEVNELLLIHYPENVPGNKLLAEAKLNYPGKVQLATDGMTIKW